MILHVNSINAILANLFTAETSGKYLLPLLEKGFHFPSTKRTPFEIEQLFSQKNHLFVVKLLEGAHDNEHTITLGEKEVKFTSDQIPALLVHNYLTDIQNHIVDLVSLLKDYNEVENNDLYALTRVLKTLTLYPIGNNEKKAFLTYLLSSLLHDIGINITGSGLKSYAATMSKISLTFTNSNNTATLIDILAILLDERAKIAYPLPLTDYIQDAALDAERMNIMKHEIVVFLIFCALVVEHDEYTDIFLTPIR